MVMEVDPHRVVNVGDAVVKVLLESTIGLDRVLRAVREPSVALSQASSTRRRERLLRRWIKRVLAGKSQRRVGGLVFVVHIGVTAAASATATAVACGCDARSASFARVYARKRF